MIRMHHAPLAMAALLLVGGIAAAKEPRGKKHAPDTKRLQGSWIADLEPGLQGRIEFEGSDLRYTHIRGDRKTPIWIGHFAVNEQSDPKQMDWTPLRKAGRGGGQKPVMSNLAIYRLQGDLLLIIGDTQGARPTAFYSGGGDQRPKTIIFRRADDSNALDSPPPTGDGASAGAISLSPTPTGR